MTDYIANILQEELQQLQDEIIQKHKDEGQYTTGRTANSLSVNINGSHGELWGASYIGVLEQGRKAGGVPKGFYHIIKLWAQNKGLSFATPADLSRFAYFVSRKIAEEGSLLHRTGGRTDILTEPIEQFQQRLTKRIAGLYQQETINNIFKTS